MILQALCKYYEQLEKEGKLPTPGWCQAKVSYAIELNQDGDVKAATRRTAHTRRLASR